MGVFGKWVGEGIFLLSNPLLQLLTCCTQDTMIFPSELVQWSLEVEETGLWTSHNERPQPIKAFSSESYGSQPGFSGAKEQVQFCACISSATPWVPRSVGRWDRLTQMSHADIKLYNLLPESIAVKPFQTCGFQCLTWLHFIVSLLSSQYAWNLTAWYLKCF